MKKTKTFKATTLRGILSAALILALALCCGGFYLTFGWVKGYAAQVNAVVIASKESGQSIGSSANSVTQLATHKAAIETVNNFLVPTASFQQQAVQDITLYANKSGINISAFKTDDTPVTATSATIASVAPSQSITVTLGAPVSYQSLIKFMTYVEQNIPKMQFVGIDIAGDPSDTNAVTVTTLTIQVFTK